MQRGPCARDVSFLVCRGATSLERDGRKGARHRGVRSTPLVRAYDGSCRVASNAPLRSRYSCSMPAAARWSTLSFGILLRLPARPPVRTPLRDPLVDDRARRVVKRSSHSTKRTAENSSLRVASLSNTRLAWEPTSPESVFGTPTKTSVISSSARSARRYCDNRSDDTTSRGRAREPPGSETATPVRASPRSRAATRPGGPSLGSATPLLDPLASGPECPSPL